VTHRPQTPWVSRGVQLFLAYVEQFFVPTLAPGDIVIMDNLGSHKGEAVRQASAAAARSSCSFRLVAPTSTPSGWSSPSSKHSCERQTNDRSRPPGSASAHCSMPSPPANAPATSETADLLQTKMITL